MVVVDSKQSLTITGNGDVLEPNDGIAGILLPILSYLSFDILNTYCFRILQMACFDLDFLKWTFSQRDRVEWLSTN